MLGSSSTLPLEHLLNLASLSNELKKLGSIDFLAWPLAREALCLALQPTLSDEAGARVMLEAKGGGRRMTERSPHAPGEKTTSYPLLEQLPDLA